MLSPIISSLWLVIVERRIEKLTYQMGKTASLRVEEAFLRRNKSFHLHFD